MGLSYGIVVLNDTGRTILSIFDIDLAQLGNHEMYLGWSEVVRVSCANGAADCLFSLSGEIRFVETASSI